MSRFEKYYGPDFNSLEKQDPEIAAVVISELVRQRQDVQLIASENFTSSASGKRFLVANTSRASQTVT